MRNHLIAAMAVLGAALWIDCDTHRHTDIAATPNSIQNIIAAEDELDEFSRLLWISDLEKMLKGDGPYTVFAPTNDAFQRLNIGRLEARSTDITVLTKMLLYHVAPGRLLLADIDTLETIETSLGVPLTVTVSGDTIRVNGARIIVSNIVGANGVIHIIDTVNLLAPLR